MKKLLYTLLVSLAFLSCDKDDFADINTKPSTVNEADIRYLLTDAISKMDVKTSYTYWFYNAAQYFYPWTQTTVSTGGNEAKDFKKVGALGSYQLYDSKLVPIADIRHLVSLMPAKEQVQYKKILAVCDILQVLNCIKYTDVYGSMAYSQAMQAKYTTPPLLAPKFESQEELFNIWIEELNQAVNDLKAEKHTFEGEEIFQTPINKIQDFVLGGDYAKWSRFGNSLKLRIAVRLLNQNKTKAFEIAKEATANTAGLILKNADEVVYNKGVKFYNFGDVIRFGNGSRHLINFLVENKDPRVRFIFDKNDFNTKVVVAFVKDSIRLPKDIQSRIITGVVPHHDDPSKDSTIFKGWKSPGEPWVRYIGAPTSPDSTSDLAIKKEYFKDDEYKIGDKKFSQLSFYNYKRMQPAKDITFPDPYEVKQDKADKEYNSVILSSAEINLYLAELKFLGANIPGTVEDYYKKGVEESVKSLDKIAKLANIPYYNAPYDEINGKAVKLVDGEINDLLTKDAYKLTGTKDLEKIYLQQYISLIDQPTEMFVTCRRSGYPSKTSSILRLPKFTETGTEMVMPRRLYVNTPEKSNVNYDNKIKAYNDQGFTPGGSEFPILNTERLWYDKGAPNWGEGK